VAHSLTWQRGVGPMTARVPNPAEAATEALEDLAVDLNEMGLDARIEECGPGRVSDGISSGHVPAD
jgi:hypothetical protein